MATVTPDEAESGLKYKLGVGEDEQVDLMHQSKEAKRSVVGKLYATLEKTVEKDPTLNGAREQHVPVLLLIPIWLIAKAAFVVVLIYLTLTAFNTDQAKKYLSPNYAFGSSGSYRLCELIPATVSGTFLLDTNGYWEGTKDFMRGKVKYAITLNNFYHDYSFYQIMMEDLKSKLDTVATRAATQSVAQNLLTWMSYAWIYVDDEVKHTMRFVADPAVVVNQVYRKAAVLSRLSKCASDPDITISDQGDVEVIYAMNGFAKAFDPSIGQKGCCSIGTIFTPIGNPLESALEVSSTWGKKATYTYTYNNPTASPTTVPVEATISLAIRFPTPSPTLSVPVTVTLSPSSNLPSSTPTPYSPVFSDMVGKILCVGPAYSGNEAVTNCAKIIASPTASPTPLPTPLPSAAPTRSPTSPAPVPVQPGPTPPTSSPPTSSPTSSPTPSPTSPATYGVLTLSSAIPIVSASNPVLIDPEAITLDDLSYIGYTPFTLRDNGLVAYPSVAEATTQYLKYADDYPGHLDTSMDGDYTTKSCVIDPVNFGYKTAFDTAKFNIKYNLRSVITAVAVNRGILPIVELDEVFTALTTDCITTEYDLTLSSTGYCQVTFDSVTYEIHTYVDNKYEKMDPIFCLIRSSRSYSSATDKFDNLCVLRVRDSFVYPYFEHMGTTSDIAQDGVNSEIFFNPSYSCACAADTYETGYLSAAPGTFTYDIRASQESAGYCNLFDLLHGFVIMSAQKIAIPGTTAMPDTTWSYNLKRILQMSTVHTHDELNKYAYVAGFASLRLSYGTQVLDSPFSNDGWSKLSAMYGVSDRAGPLQFCNGYPYSNNSATGLDLTGNAYQSPDCAIFAMNTYDEGAPKVDNNHLNIMYPHCANEFSIPNSSWGRNITWRYDTSDVPEAHNSLAGKGAFYIPPEELTQSYYVCYNKVVTSLALAFGSSAGTAGIVASLVITLLVTLVTAAAKKKVEDGGKEAGGNSQGAVMAVGTEGTGGAIEMSHKK